MAELKTIVVGMLDTNCYIYYNSKNEAIIIDPGFEAGKIIKTIQELNLTPKKIILTHGHFDHVSGIDELNKAYPDAEINIHKADFDWYKNGKKTANEYFNTGFTDTRMPEDVNFVNEGHYIEIDEISLKVYSTPGHSGGSISLVDEENLVVFSGDTLFRGGIGRTDLAGGSYDDIMNSIKNKLLKLDPEYKVYPGHGGSTSIKFEKKHNMFLL